MPKNSNKRFNVKDLYLKSLNNTTAEEFMVFDSDSSYLYLDSCVTRGLTGFKSDFIDELCAAVTERSYDTTTCKSIIIGEDIASFTLKDDTGELYTLKNHMAYASIN